MSFADFSVKNPVLVNLAMAAIVLIGLIMAFQLPLEMFPSVQLELVTVTTVYRGAAAEDTEQLVTIPIEDEISDIKGIKDIRSTSSEGLSSVVAELEAGEDVRKRAEDIRSEIDRIRNKLPADAEPPVVQEIEAVIPLINVSISGRVPRPMLRRYAIRLRDELKLVPGVGTIWSSGLGDPVFWVRVQPAKLRQFHIGLQAVVQAIARKNLDLPGGSYRQGLMEFLVRTRGRVHRRADLLDIPVRTNPAGRHVYLRDVARVDLGEEKHTTLNRVNGLPAITFFINKQKNMDAIRTVQSVRRLTSDFEHRIPDSIHIYNSNDTSYWVRQRFHTMLKNGLIGLMVVMVIMGAFLDLRAAVMATLGLPVAFLGAIIIMHFTGITFNVLSMFGLILVLGIIVDDAIIVAENIQRYVAMGLPTMKAAVKGAREVAAPVIATVLTNVASFIPLLMASGLIGKFLATIPKVAIFAFMVSLFEALFILPSHCADFLKPTRPKDRKRSWVFRIRRVYLEALFFVIRHRYTTVAAFVLVLLVTVGVLSQMPFSLIYTRDIAQYNIRLQNPTWSGTEATMSSVKKVEAVVQSLVPAHALKNVVSLIGMDISRREPEFGDHLATIMVEYVDFEKRKENGLVLMNRVRAASRDITGPDRLEFLRTEGPPTGRPVDVRIQGREFATLKTLALDAERFLRGLPGVYDVSDDLTWGKPEIRVHVQEDRAAMFGLDTTSVARAVRAAVDGLEVSRTRIGKEEARIIVRYDLPPGDIMTILQTAQVPSPKGGWIPLSHLVRLETRPSMLRIARYDMERAVRVTADIDQKTTTARETNRKLGDYLAQHLRNFPGYTFAFGGEEEETRESIRSILEAMVITIILIYGILASMLKSYAQPFIIMSVLPFAIVGVAVGMLLRGEPFSLPALIGTVALLGIVVNDSLVLMDFINNRRKDLHRITAVVYSAKYRFRPVILTTITTFGGLFSLMLKTRGEAAFLAPMAIALGFGLVFATLITLFLIPSLFLVLDDLQRVVRHRLHAPHR